MKTERISRLLEAFKSAQAQPINTPQQAAQSAQAVSRNSDAVQIAAGFGNESRKAQEAGDQDKAKQQDKVSRLKAQVQAGVYKPSSEQVAGAVIKELSI